MILFLLRIFLWMFMWKSSQIFNHKAWDYDVNIFTLVVNLYKLVVLEYYDDEQQITIILS